MKTEIKTRIKLLTGSIVLIAFLIGCKQEVHTYDGSGTFEATEIVISAEATGTIMELNVREGGQYPEGEILGYIDTTLLHLKKVQIEAQIQSLKQGIPNVEAQTRFYDQQVELARINLSHLENEKDRIQNLVTGEAATQKQLDDITAQVAQAMQQIQVLLNQKEAQISALTTQKSGIMARPLPFQAQLKEINEKIRRSRIINPRKGTVLTSYVEAGEFVAPGKPLYRLADLSDMHLRAFIGGNQYAQIRLHQEVTVFTDDGQGEYHQERGTISWISDEAEFTPKTIRTKEERENLVYAIKVRVPNDGRYKIGMYGEVKF